MRVVGVERYDLRCSFPQELENEPTGFFYNGLSLNLSEKGYVRPAKFINTTHVNREELKNLDYLGKLGNLYISLVQ